MMSKVCFRIKQALHAFVCMGVLVVWRVIDERWLAMLSKLGDECI